MYPCIILCGGLATRLGLIASETPKCLLEVNSKPFLYYQLKLLEESDIKEVYLSVGHMSENFFDFINKYNFKNIKIKLVDDGSTPLGTGGAVKNILKKIKTPSFVMYGDSYLRINFFNVFQKYKPDSGPMLVIYKNENKYDKSNIYFDGDNIIYNKKNPSIKCNFIDYGIGIYKYTDFDNTPDSFDLSLIQENFSQKKQLQYFKAYKKFIEIGTPQSYKNAEEFFKKDEIK